MLSVLDTLPTLSFMNNGHPIGIYIFTYEKPTGKRRDYVWLIL